MLYIGYNQHSRPIGMSLIYLYSFKLLFVKVKSDLVLNNTWIFLYSRESKIVSEVVRRIFVWPRVIGQNTCFVIKFFISETFYYCAKENQK